jgi:hypothetical protein
VIIALRFLSEEEDQHGTVFARRALVIRVFLLSLPALRDELEPEDVSGDYLNCPRHKLMLLDYRDAFERLTGDGYGKKSPASARNVCNSIIQQRCFEHNSRRTQNFQLRRREPIV